MRALIAAALLLATSPALADEAADKGRALALEAQKRDTGWKDAQNVFVMTLGTKAGPTATRQLSFKSLEINEAGRGDKSLIKFEAPKDVRDTALLTFSRDKGSDDQWIYLPALKRVKRIASSNKSGPFMGSEFAYEDFANAGVDKFTYRWLREEPCGQSTCDVLERIPAYDGSGYSKQVVWMDQAERRILKSDYYDKRGKLLKTLHSRNWRQYADKFWRAQDLLMVNHQTGKTTRLSWGPFKFGTGIDENDFDAARLAQQ